MGLSNRMQRNGSLRRAGRRLGKNGAGEPPRESENVGMVAVIG